MKYVMKKDISVKNAKEIKNWQLKLTRLMNSENSK
jgi:hypothetical protein